MRFAPQLNQCGSETTNDGRHQYGDSIREARSRCRPPEQRGSVFKLQLTSGARGAAFALPRNNITVLCYGALSQPSTRSGGTYMLRRPPSGAGRGAARPLLQSALWLSYWPRPTA
ncbi:hypothetical protein EVAR_19768_1 [Eumeta japonica]|uniref:Uncharacterized protein n=1 Tax=Eumeta variegata TaxID=151549 RepID=A0A4C1URX5_EUMVA|nr:hypothetical protein EVAR_19768_1 [Eumeta japonica]